jgi:deoxyhypusine synthase
MNHYKVPIKLSDKELYALKLNRVYDSIEPESNLVALEKFACKVFSKLNPENGYGSFEIIRHLADEMIKGKKPDGFLGAANTHCVNVYVPALSDSELGLYLFRYSKHSKQSTKNNIIYDPFKDLSEYSRWLCRQKRIAFLTLGGGSPRNWGQQMLPFLKTQKKAGELHSKDNIPEVAAAIRICPDPAELGHLSGATYSEGITWGKFEAKNDDHFVEIQCDATIVFPILAKLLCDYVDQKANKR